MYVIYALIDPRDNTVHYVGQTNDVYVRFQQHINGNGTFAKNGWMFELRSANRMIIMATLEEVETYQEAIEREVYWIKHFESLGAPLLNVRREVTVYPARKIQAAAHMLVALKTSEIREKSLKKTFEVSEEDEQAIINTAYELQELNGRVTREAIKAKLGWNNAKHPSIKAVCDKHHIAER